MDLQIVNEGVDITKGREEDQLWTSDRIKILIHNDDHINSKKWSFYIRIVLLHSEKSPIQRKSI